MMRGYSGLEPKEEVDKDGGKVDREWIATQFEAESKLPARTFFSVQVQVWII
jgi:hypothetical protein